MCNADITNAIFYNTSQGVATTEVQITKAFGNINGTQIPSNIASNSVTHIINKTNVQSAGVLSNADIVTWTDTALSIDSNQAVFKIWNVAPSTDVEVLTIGTPSDYSAESGLNNDLFDITRDTRKDAYTFTINNTNYDSRNYGYWYVEDVQYNINFTTNNIRTADYYTL